MANKTYTYLTAKGNELIERKITACYPDSGDWYVSLRVYNQIKFVNNFFGSTNGIEFIFGSDQFSILDLIKKCNDGDSVMVVDSLWLTEEYWSLDDIGNICLERGVSFEILNPPFKHCDTKESKKTLLAVEFANMMARDYPLPNFEDEYE